MCENNQIKTENETRKQAIAQGLSQITLEPVKNDIEIMESSAVKLPFNMLPSLGVGFASISEFFHAVSQAGQSGTCEQLYRALTENGITLKQAADGTFSSAAMRPDGTSAWAKFQAVGSPSATVPFNPTSIAMAVALAQINKKLDGIQNTLNEMFDYLLLKDKADIRASLETLASIFNDYKFNWNNDQFKQSKYTLVQSVNRDARQHIIELRAQAISKTKKNGFIETRGQSGDAANEILDLLKEYRLAVYLYSFSIFLGIILLENYDEQYLESKAADIRQKAIDYRELYTLCYNAIESRNRESIDSFVLGGISAGIKGIGKIFEKTPLGDVTDIDEALIGAGSQIEGFDSEENERIAASLTAAKDPAVLPFAESIDSVNSAYNHPFQLYISNEALYFLTDES